MCNANADLRVEKDHVGGLDFNIEEENFIPPEGRQHKTVNVKWNSLISTSGRVRWRYRILVKGMSLPLLIGKLTHNLPCKAPTQKLSRTLLHGQKPLGNQAVNCDAFGPGTTLALVKRPLILLLQW